MRITIILLCWERTVIKFELVNINIKYSDLNNIKLYMDKKIIVYSKLIEMFRKMVLHT